MRTGHYADIDTTRDEFAPAKILLQRAEQGLAPSAKESDSSCVWTRNVRLQGVEMNLPELEFIFLKLGKIDYFLQIDSGTQRTSLKGEGTS